MRLTCLLLCLSAAPAAAQENRIVEAFEGWMDTQAVTTASIAVVEGNASTASVTKGYNQPADTPITLASLSKAITAACIAVLQQEAVFDLDADVSTLLTMDGAQGPLGDFLSHSSGLTPDRTQGQPRHLQDDRAPRHAQAAGTAFKAARGPAEFSYNNENYAVLGAVIDAVAQVDYETDCRQLVLEPLGITSAKLDPVWGPHGAWGGWAMSAPDYARFVTEWFGSERNIGRDPLSWPHADLGEGLAYVMGAFHRTRRGENLFWHAGQLCWNGEGAGSYFASYGGDPVVVVSFEGCVDDAGFALLDRALFDAALR